MIALDFVHTKIHTSKMKIAGIEWDDGNWPKCGKHGVSQDKINHALRHIEFRIPDPNPKEIRFRTASITPKGRHIFIVYTHRERVYTHRERVYTHRERDGETYLRPISARYMHEKEVAQYEQIEEKMANSFNG